MNESTVSILMCFSSTILRKRKLFIPFYSRNIKCISEIGIYFLNSLDKDKALVDILLVYLNDESLLISSLFLHFFCSMIAYFEKDINKVYFWATNRFFEDCKKQSSIPVLSTNDEKYVETPILNTSFLIKTEKRKTAEISKDIIVSCRVPDWCFSTLKSAGTCNWCIFASFTYQEGTEEVVNSLFRSGASILIQKRVDERCKEILLLRRIPFFEKIGEYNVSELRIKLGIPIFQSPLEYLLLVRGRGLCNKRLFTRSKYKLSRVYGACSLRFRVKVHPQDTKKFEVTVTTPTTNFCRHPYVEEVNVFLKFHSLLLFCILKDSWNLSDEKIKSLIESVLDGKKLFSMLKLTLPLLGFLG